MSASGLQVISVKLSVVLSAIAAVSIASAAYLLSDNQKQMPDPMLHILEQYASARAPDAAVVSSDSQSTGSPSTSLPPIPTIPTVTPSPPPIKPHYRLISIVRGPPREAVLQSGTSECPYGLGDIVPGWGAIIAITDRSVLSMKSQLSLMPLSTSTHVENHSSSTDSCMPSSHPASKAASPPK